jgi:hypothetical protein
MRRIGDSVSFVGCVPGATCRKCSVNCSSIDRKKEVQNGKVLRIEGASYTVIFPNNGTVSVHKLAVISTRFEDHLKRLRENV